MGRFAGALVLMHIAHGLDFQDENEVWHSGIDFEISHHSKWLCGEGCGFKQRGWFAYEKTTKLAGKPVEPHRSRLCAVIAAHMDRPVRLMLDHGAGPFTNLGARFTCPEHKFTMSGWMPVDAQVIALDPLAPLYHKLLNNYSVYNTLRTQRCGSEHLVACLGREVIDVSIIINALDHSQNAPLAWQEALQVTAVGGLACVFSVANEATHQGGTGFHKWNFHLTKKEEWTMTNFASGRVTNIDTEFAEYAKRVAIPTSSDPMAQNAGQPFPPDQFMACYQKLRSMPVTEQR